MDEQEQVVVAGRRRRSRAEAEQLGAEFEASGVSRDEFCRKHGLSLATLARYRKWQRQVQSEAAGVNRWVAVGLSGGSLAAGSSAGSGLAIALPDGRRIEVGRGFDAHTLIQLLGLLEHCWACSAWGRRRASPSRPGLPTCARASKVFTGWRATGCCASR